MIDYSNIIPAGCIVCDETAIWGVGANEDAAWSDMKTNMAQAGITVVDELTEDADGSPAPDQTLSSLFKIRWATQELLNQVEAQGGNIAWGIANGTACTIEQDEALAA